MIRFSKSVPRVESFIFHFRLSERSSPHNAVRKEWWWEVGGGGVSGVNGPWAGG